MNRKNPNRRPSPSYEEGHLRDPKIEEMQDAEYEKGDLLKLLGKAVKQVPKGSD